MLDKAGERIQEKPEFSLIILAGELYSGRADNKVSQHDDTISQTLDRQITNLPSNCIETIIITDDPVQYLQYDSFIMSGIWSPANVLTGIHAGLLAANSLYNLFIADNADSLEPDKLYTLIHQLNEHFEAFIPQNRADSDPLCAVFMKTCLNRIENHLRKQDFSLNRFISKIKVKRIVF